MHFSHLFQSRSSLTNLKDMNTSQRTPMGLLHRTLSIFSHCRDYHMRFRVANFISSTQYAFARARATLPKNCVYYDGCLVADLFGSRVIHPKPCNAFDDTWHKHGSFHRILLRPDSCHQVADTDSVTGSLDYDEPIEMERKFQLALPRQCSRE